MEEDVWSELFKALANYMNGNPTSSPQESEARAADANRAFEKMAHMMYPHTSPNIAQPCLGGQTSGFFREEWTGFFNKYQIHLNEDGIFSPQELDARAANLTSAFHTMTDTMFSSLFKNSLPCAQAPGFYPYLEEGLEKDKGKREFHRFFNDLQKFGEKEKQKAKEWDPNISPEIGFADIMGDVSRLRKHLSYLCEDIKELPSSLADFCYVNINVIATKALTASGTPPAKIAELLDMESPARTATPGASSFDTLNL